MSLSAKKRVGTVSGKSQRTLRVRLVHHRQKEQTVMNYLSVMKDLLAFWAAAKVSEDLDQIRGFSQKIAGLKVQLPAAQLADLPVQLAAESLQRLFKMVEEGLDGNRIHCYIAYEEVLQSLDSLRRQLTVADHQREITEIADLKRAVGQSLLA